MILNVRPRMIITTAGPFRTNASAMREPERHDPRDDERDTKITAEAARIAKDHTRSGPDRVASDRDFPLCE